MPHRTAKRRRRRTEPVDLPDDPSLGALARLRRTAPSRSGSALDAVDAEDRAALARSPGYFRLGLRLSFVGVVVLGLLSVLLVRLWSIQVIHAGASGVAALANPTRNVLTPAPRGSILARGGQPLATDKEEEVVTLKRSEEGTTWVASTRAEDDLAALIPGLTVAEIRRQLDNKQYSVYEPVPVAEGITAAQATFIGENPGEFPGVSVSEEYVRDYPQGSLAAQMIGYTGPFYCTAKSGSKACETETERFDAHHEPTDLVGASGLELEYNTALEGTDGVEKVEVTPADAEVKTVKTTPPVEGDSVVLNMDLPLEQELAKDLEAQITTLRSSQGVPADWGAAVVLGPQGQVLAMVSLPSYDDNEWVGGISDADYDALEKTPGDPLNDYAVAGDQPPGSTFKLATATAALDDGVITPETEIDDPGYFDEYGLDLHEDDDIDFGEVDVTRALTVSSDVFFYNLGADLWLGRAKYGDDAIQKVANEYGYGEPSGIDLPGEEPGWVDSLAVRKALHEEYPSVYGPATWYLGDNVEMAFGQGKTVITPLEEAEAYSTFSDGGTRYAPEMAAEIVSPSGKVVKKIAPKAEAKVSYTPGTYQAILAGLEGVVSDPSGTAYTDFNEGSSQFPPFPGFSSWTIAGKTGTADVALNGKQPTAWFVAFGGPKDDPSERYTVAVEIDQAGYGADASAPVVDGIFDYLYSHKLQPLGADPGS